MGLILTAGQYTAETGRINIIAAVLNSPEKNSNRPVVKGKVTVFNTLLIHDARLLAVIPILLRR
jgi:hypothetical protein